jgi:hypothetical protein
VASKSAYSDAEKGAEIEEQLEDLDKRVDRLRVIYEQYFMGIQKQAPSVLHSECERRIRELTQLQIRNTGLRYRFATITQKFGAYNTYWRRTLREIEAGRYVRDLNRVKRKALAGGEEIPAEILAAMPKRMREMVERDRAAAKSLAARRGGAAPAAPAESDGDDAAVVHNPIPRQREWTLDMDDALDVDQAFDDITGVGNKARAPVAAPVVVPVVVPVEPTRASTVSGNPPPPVPSPPKLPAIPRRPPPIPPRAANKPVSASPSFPAFDDEAPTGLRKSADNAAAPRAPAPAPPPAPPPAVAPPPLPRPVPPRPAARVAPVEPPPGMSEDDTRALYNKFLKARSLVGEKNDDMTYDKLLRTLRQQGSKIMEQYKAKGVEFGVVIKDNKVILKAKPKV